MPEVKAGAPIVVVIPKQAKTTTVKDTVQARRPATEADVGIFEPEHGPSTAEPDDKARQTPGYWHQLAGQQTDPTQRAWAEAEAARLAVTRAPDIAKSRAFGRKPLQEHAKSVEELTYGTDPEVAEARRAQLADLRETLRRHAETRPITTQSYLGPTTTKTPMREAVVWGRREKELQQKIKALEGASIPLEGETAVERAARLTALSELETPKIARTPVRREVASPLSSEGQYKHDVTRILGRLAAVDATIAAMNEDKARYEAIDPKYEEGRVVSSSSVLGYPLPLTGRPSSQRIKEIDARTAALQQLRRQLAGIAKGTLQTGSAYGEVEDFRSVATPSDADRQKIEGYLTNRGFGKAALTAPGLIADVPGWQK